jgi:hypothetical protein
MNNDTIDKVKAFIRKHYTGGPTCEYENCQFPECEHVCGYNPDREKVLFYDVPGDLFDELMNGKRSAEIAGMLRTENASARACALAQVNTDAYDMSKLYDALGQAEAAFDKLTDCWEAIRTGKTLTPEQTVTLTIYGVIM